MSAILDTPKRTRQRRHEAPPVLFYAHVRLLLVSSPASGEVAPRRDRLVCLRRKRRLHSPANVAATDSLLLNLKSRRVIAMGKTSSFNDPNRGGSFSARATCVPCSTRAKYGLLYALLLSTVLLAQRSAAPVSQWEAQLAKQPDNIDLRSNLIREYFRLSRQDPGAEQARVVHVLWMVTHRPEASVMGEPTVTVSRPGEGYDAVEKAWLVQVNKPGVTPQRCWPMPRTFSVLWIWPAPLNCWRTHGSSSRKTRCGPSCLARCTRFKSSV